MRGDTARDVSDRDHKRVMKLMRDVSKIEARLKKLENQ